MIKTVEVLAIDHITLAGDVQIYSYTKIMDTDVKYILLFIVCKYPMLLISIVVHPSYIFNIKT